MNRSQELQETERMLEYLDRAVNEGDHPGFLYELEDLYKNGHLHWLLSQSKRVEEFKENQNATIYTHNLQAERIRKLEKELRYLHNIHSTLESSHFQAKEINDRLVEENQRYEQALEEIRRQHGLEDEIDDHDFMWNVEQIARQTLEGDAWKE